MAENATKKTGSTESKVVRKNRTKAVGKKTFVLDTNVLLHDPTSLFRFAEHDVYLPMVTLEELDNHKKGMEDVARNARAIARTFDALITKASHGTPDGKLDLDAGIPLNLLGNKESTGKLRFQTKPVSAIDLPGLDGRKADNEILSVVASVKREEAERTAVLVSKDINVRIKANVLGLDAEDYFNDHVLQDSDLLYTGSIHLPVDFWDTIEGKVETKTVQKENGHTVTIYRVKHKLVKQMLINQYVHSDDFDARVVQIDGANAVFETLRTFDSSRKKEVFGIMPRNREQNFALNLLLDRDCDLVTLLGQAGTGKTLLALAAGLKQVYDDKLYDEIIVTRATVPVGEEIGFLPGTEEEKMGPWMGAIDDNLEVLTHSTDDKVGDSAKKLTDSFIRSRVKIKSMSFMRGRTFLNKFVIVDEAQNLTPKQVKTLLTRAGPGTKMVLMGNLAQIDTPYMTEGSSGLTHAVDRLKGWKHNGHITLVRGERSRLADHANEVL